MKRNWLNLNNLVFGIAAIAVQIVCGHTNAAVYGPFTSVYVASSSNFSGVATGDIDNDGDLDLAVCSPNAVGWYRNNGAGLIWSSYSLIENANWGCPTVFLKDFDNDGDLDLFGGRTDATGTCHACWWRNSSNGASWTRFDIGTAGIGGSGGPVHWVEPADINADGMMDVAYASYREIGWIARTGGTAPNFTYSKTILETSTVQYRCAHPANLDSDPQLEITGTLYYGNMPPINRFVSIWGLPQGRADISTPSSNPVSGAWAAWDLDFDGDGDKDVAVCGLGSPVKIWRNDGNGQFTYHSQIASATSLRSGRFDNSTPVRDSLVTGGEYRVLNWTGSTWDVSNVALQTGNFSQAGVSLGDMDLDGDLDIAGPANNATLNWWRKP